MSHRLLGGHGAGPTARVPGPRRLATLDPVRPAPTTTPRGTGLAIASIAAIPFIAVTSVAWLGNVASQTEPTVAIGAGLALAGGLLMGLLVRRLVTTVDRRLRHIARRLLRIVARFFERPSAAPAAHPLAAGLGLAPARVFVPARVGRRGPPVLVH